MKLHRSTVQLRAQLAKELELVKSEIAYSSMAAESANESDALGTLAVNLLHACRIADELRQSINPVALSLFNGFDNA